MGRRKVERYVHQIRTKTRWASWRITDKGKHTIKNDEIAHNSDTSGKNGENASDVISFRELKAKLISEKTSNKRSL